MKSRYSALIVGVVLVMVVGIQPELAVSATLLDADMAAQVVVARNVTVKEGEVSGELLNKSPRLIRDVQLLVRHTWHWKNEFRPGKDDPGMAVYYTVEKEIPSGGTMPFTYRPSSPLPSRPDGYFETIVSVAGFTEIFR